MLKIWQEIEQKIKAGYPYFYLVTHEESRVGANLSVVAKRLGMQLFKHSQYKGFVPGVEQDKTQSVLEAIVANKQAGVYLLNDFHSSLGDLNIIRQIKDCREELIKSKKCVFVTAPVLALPVELEKYFTVVDVPLPDVYELKLLFKQIAQKSKIDSDDKLAEVFARSATGLTAEEAMLVFSRMMLDAELIKAGDTSIVIEEKRRLVESEGVLQFYDRAFELKDVGGMHSLKNWLKEREEAFDESARGFGLPQPKGLLLLGVQGCGKSLTAKAIASHWKIPLVQLDLGSAFSGFRSPEETIRRSLKLLEALSPVVVWIDEIEKGFAGTKQAGGEVSTNRVFGQFITWMQEKQSPVFVVATANSVDELPPELLRKGRFDELFFVDLPDAHEREEIIKVHLAKRKIDHARFDLHALVDETRNYSGAELEQIVIDALYRAFAEKRKLSDDDLVFVAKEMVPIYNTYEEDIKRLRDWSRNRTKKASVDSTLSDYFIKEDNS